MSNYTKTTNFATKDNLSPGNPLKIVKGTEIDTEYNNIATAVATKTDNASAAITGGSITGITDLAVADGGTGASTAAGALNNLLPSQTSNANKYLQTDGTNATWDAVSLSTADITGTLPVANGGTGVTSSTGTGNVVLSNSPTLVTPALGTPASGVATNLTGLPLTTGVTGTLPVANGGTGITSFGVGVATFLGTPSSANLASAVTDETGSGALVFANSPTLVTPALGTPSALVGTNITGTASGLTAGSVTTNANLTGAVTSVGNATSLGSFSSSNLASALTDETGTGSAVFATSPTLVTPILGTPTSATLTNATGLPLTTGVTGQLPVANGGTGTATPSIVAGTNITVTGTWPNQTIAASGGSGTVTSVAATVPSLFSISGSPITTSGTLAMTYSGTALPVANGGTGETSYTNGQLLIGNTTGNTLTKATLTAGTGISITNGTGSISIAASGGGDVAGPASSTDNAIARFDSTTGKLIQNSVVTIADTTGDMAGVGTLSATGGTAGPAGAYTAIFKNSDNGNSGSIQLGGTSFGALIYRDSVGANSELIFVNSHAANKGFKFFTGSTIQGTTQLAAIGATGCIAVGAATPSTDGAGITFPATQSASTDANTLDDYEEGDWTPTITISSAGTFASSSAVGRYTKVGNLVTVMGRISFTKGTGSGNLILGGLPFASANISIYQSPAAISTDEFGVAGKIYQIVIPQNTTVPDFLSISQTNGTVASASASDFGAGGTAIRYMLSYHTT